MIAIEGFPRKLRTIVLRCMLIDVDHDCLCLTEIVLSPVATIGYAAFDNRLIAIWHFDHLKLHFPRSDNLLCEMSVVKSMQKIKK